MSASYNALISWLLTLVAVDTDVIAGEESTAVPFRVIGLQQMLLGGQLALHVAVVSVKRFTTRDLRSRSKVLCSSVILCFDVTRLHELISDYSVAVYSLLSPPFLDKMTLKFVKC